MYTCQNTIAPLVTRAPLPDFPTPEIKDPSVVKANDGQYHMYASVGNSISQQWKVGHFISQSPEGPWTELPAVTFEGVWGRELCAPAVTYCENRGEDPWVMYIQTSCFSEDGIIVKATSRDGSHFKGTMEPELHRESLIGNREPVIGVYDAGISEMTHNNERLECLLISGYRKIGCGDLYASFRPANNHTGVWPKAHLILAQEDLPFHNAPNYEHFEWGLEGAKILPLSHSLFLLVGVCFKPLPNGAEGTRQRVFFAIGRSFKGKFYPWSLPLEGAPGNTLGEHGHPDTLIEGNSLWFYYQHRLGANEPWYLRHTEFHVPALIDEGERVLRNFEQMQSEEEPLRYPTINR